MGGWVGGWEEGERGPSLAEEAEEEGFVVLIGWMGGWLNELFSCAWLGRGEGGGSNELLYAMGLGEMAVRRIGGWVGG